MLGSNHHRWLVAICHHPPPSACPRAFASQVFGNADGEEWGDEEHEADEAHAVEEEEGGREREVEEEEEEEEAEEEEAASNGTCRPHPTYCQVMS